jgi:hypothetical protein
LLAAILLEFASQWPIALIVRQMRHAMEARNV